MNLTDEQLSEVMRLIRGLNPAPGELVSDGNPEYVVPDVVVSRRGKRWLVELNPESMPKVRINDHYAGMIRHTRREEDGSYLKAQLQEAKWFLKSLQSRNETLLKVATRIVEVQQGFFEYGEEAMKPLVLAEIADAVGMHESTISRVTNQKYMHTPKGVFELKYFSQVMWAQTAAVNVQAPPFVPLSRSWSRPRTPANRSVTTNWPICSTSRVSRSPAAPSPNTGRRCAFRPPVIASVWSDWKAG